MGNFFTKLLLLGIAAAIIYLVGQGDALAGALTKGMVYYKVLPWALPALILLCAILAAGNIRKHGGG